MTHAGKTALITGAAGGLGRAIAEHFLSLGANIVICDVNDSLLADFNAKVTAAHPSRTLALKSNVTSEADLDALFAAAEQTFGALHYVVNSCGVMDLFDPAGTTDTALWDRVIAINLTAPMQVTKRAVNAFLRNDVKGAIVNIASVASISGYASGVAYTASKHGLIGVTKNTAAFYRLKGIRCNAICAGAMNTNIGNALANGGLNMEGMAVMKTRFGEWEGGISELEKMATLVAYLCSGEASMINGAVVTADGGITAA